MTRSTSDYTRLVSTLIHPDGDWISTWQHDDDAETHAWYGQAWVAGGVGNPVAYCPVSGPHATRRAAYEGALAEYTKRLHHASRASDC